MQREPRNSCPATGRGQLVFSSRREIIVDFSRARFLSGLCESRGPHSPAAFSPESLVGHFQPGPRGERLLGIQAVKPVRGDPSACPISPRRTFRLRWDPHLWTIRLDGWPRRLSQRGSGDVNVRQPRWTSRSALVIDIESQAQFLPSERMGKFRARIAIPDPRGRRPASRRG